MKIKVLMCNCKGLCDSFKDTDFNTLPFQVESELEVAYVGLHPQTCGQGGNEMLADLMRAAAADTYIISAACAPNAQEKLFRKIMRQTGFPPERFIAVDIRMTNNEGVLERLREAVDNLLRKENASKEASHAELSGACSCSGVPVDQH